MMATAAKPESASAPATAVGESKPANVDSGGEKPYKGPDSGEPAGDKPADGTLHAPVVPEKYELKLSDGSPFDAAFVNAFSAKAKENKFTQEQAQSVFDHLQGQVTERLATLSKSELKGGDAYEARVGQWNREIAADKEIGGANYRANLSLAQRTAAQFFDTETLNFLEESGYGSAPGLVKALVKIGKAIGEDRLVKAPGTSEEPKKKPAEQVMYPGHYDEGGKPK